MKVNRIVIILVFCRVCKCVDLSESLPNQEETVLTSNAITVNIDHEVDKNSVFLYQDQLNGLKYKKYTPKQGIVITSVVDSKGKVWSASSNEGCTGIHTCRNDRFNTIILLSIEEGENSVTKFLESNGIGWTPITETAFKEKFENMKLVSSPLELKTVVDEENKTFSQVTGTNEGKPLEGCGFYADLVKIDTFDMTNINPNNFCTIKDSFSGLESIGYLPTYCVKKVVDGDQLVWEAAKDEKNCTNIEFYSNRTMIIVVLLINKHPSPNECKLFEYLDNKVWVQVPDSEFESKINSMKNEKVQRECLRCG